MQGAFPHYAVVLPCAHFTAARPHPIFTDFRLSRKRQKKPHKINRFMSGFFAHTIHLKNNEKRLVNGKKMSSVKYFGEPNLSVECIPPKTKKV